MSSEHVLVSWNDAGREPKCAPNPEYPNGIDLDASNGSSVTCTVKLPYPAKRCGQYFLECTLCKFTAIVITAGRPDDPKSIRLPCQESK